MLRFVFAFLVNWLCVWLAVRVEFCVCAFCVVCVRASDTQVLLPCKTNMRACELRFVFAFWWTCARVCLKKNLWSSPVSIPRFKCWTEDTARPRDLENRNGWDLGEQMKIASNFSLPTTYTPGASTPTYAEASATTCAWQIPNKQNLPMAGIEPGN